MNDYPRDTMRDIGGSETIDGYLYIWVLSHTDLGGNMTVEKAGETFSGYNKPKRTPKHPKKSHAVLAKSGGKEKLIRFGQQGVTGAGKNPQSKKDKARKKSYYARHNAQDPNPGPLSARYWSHKVKW